MPLSKAERDRLLELLDEVPRRPKERQWTALGNKLDALRDAIKSMQLGAVATTGTRRGDEDEESTGFSEFFEEVGKSMIATQRQLDEASESYLASVGDRPHLLPSVFRMPTLSGELKVGLKDFKNKGSNLLVFSRKSGSEKLQEHTLKFELAASPPPQEAVHALRTGLPMVRVVTSTALRDEALRLAKNALEPARFLGTAAQLAFAKKALEEFPARTLVLSTGGEQLYLLTDLGAEEKDIGLWRLAQRDEVWTLEPIWRLGSGSGYARLADLLSTAFERQDELNGGE